MDNMLLYPHSSRRAVAFSKKGMTATSQPLAAQAGLDMLKAGGNAVDAAVAMAMALTVVEPTSNGIGSDAFCIVWHEGKMYGLNASGPAPMGISVEKVLKLGHKKMPERGGIPVTVPGAPAAWATLSKKFGKLPLPKLAESAIDYATNGYPVSPTVAENWQIAHNCYKTELSAGLYKIWTDTFNNKTKNSEKGWPPKPGQIFKLPHHAQTLKEIAETNAESFYRGGLADKISKFFRENGAFLDKSDLEAFVPQWVRPIKASFRGHDIWELPPNGQGLVALMALQVLEGLTFRGFGDPKDTHNMIEAVKLAFTDGSRYITDPAFMPVTTEKLLSAELAEKRRLMLTSAAIDPETIPFKDHGTVYLCTADSNGTMVSYIQSNYMEFGSGVVIPNTGIAMQNRGANFSLDPKHPNCLAPGKRPYHTIIPGFITKGSEPIGPFGVMGGFMQPQGHVQVLVNMLEYGMNPQAALDAPRWMWLSGKKLILETNSPRSLSDALTQMGHEVEFPPNSTLFGRGQIIQKNKHGSLTGATEPRCDGTVALW